MLSLVADHGVPAQTRAEERREESDMKRAQAHNNCLHISKEVEEKLELPLKTTTTLSC